MHAKKLTVFILLIVSACQQKKAAMSDEAKADVVTEVRQTLNNYLAAVKRDGLTAEFDYLDHSSDFFWVPPGYNSPISYDSVAAFLRTSASLFKSVENSFDTLRIIPLTEELATYTAKLRSVMTDTSGNVTSIKLIETGVVIKRNDRWKLLSGQTSLIDSEVKSR